MGQQETATMTVAEAETKGGALRRIVLVLAVASLMAVMMTVSALPAMAKASPNPSETGGGPPVFTGGLELDNPSSEVFHARGGACVKHFGNSKKQETGGSCL
jgi:hypothetical protein